MSNDEPKTTDVLDTAANQNDPIREDEIVNKDAVANTESATEVPVTDDSVTAPVGDEVTAASTETQQTDKDKAKDTDKDAENAEKDPKPATAPAEDTSKKSTEDDELKSGTEPVVDTIKEELKSAQSTKIETVNNAELEEVCYPFTIRPIVPVTIFRGPSLIFAGRTFGGFMEIIGPSRNGFFPVSYVRAGLGRTTGYIKMTDEEVRKCQSWK